MRMKGSMGKGYQKLGWGEVGGPGGPRCILRNRRDAGTIGGVHGIQQRPKRTNMNPNMNRRNAKLSPNVAPNLSRRRVLKVAAFSIVPAYVLSASQRAFGGAP